MNQPEYILPNGTHVRTHPHLGTTQGMENVNGHNLRRRRGNAPGIVLYPVPGMGGDVYWVQHGEGDTAPYCFTEFELVESDGKRPRYPTFATFLAALNAGEIPRARVELAEYTSSGCVVANLRAEHERGEDDPSDVLLYRSDSLETFLIDVAKAIGVEGAIW